MATLSTSSVRAVVRAAVELTSRHDRAAVLEVILAELERLVPFDLAAVLLRDGDELRVVAARGFRRDVDARGLRFELGANPRLDRALAAAGTLRFVDPDEPDPYDALAAHELQHLHSCMAAPLRVHGRVIGVVTTDAYDPDRFAAEHEELIELFAALAAVAIENADLVSALEHARAKLAGQVDSLAEEIRGHAGVELVGESPPIVALRAEIAAVGPTDTTVLVLGETGTGKELVARALHRASRRSDRPMIRVDCAAVAPTLIEAELYGHARGAFTGATAARPGKIEIADGATLFLDEIGELPLDVQPRLLRALQEREVERVGEHQVRRVDVRVIAATNRDLEAEVRAGRFRADLFHRLAVYPIRVPTLAERLGDIPELIAHVARRLAPRLGLEGVDLRPGFAEALAVHRWPGNVRELENAVERALIRARRTDRRVAVLDRADAGVLGGAAPARAAAPVVELPPGGTLRARLLACERQILDEELRRAGGNVAAAARALGEDRSNLHRRIRRIGLGGEP
jgi:anaerobic nitric oxide reductase transcription regulator